MQEAAYVWKPEQTLCSSSDIFLRPTFKMLMPMSRRSPENLNEMNVSEYLRFVTGVAILETRF